MYDYSNKFDMIKSIMFIVAVICIITVWLLSSGKADEMKKNKSKTTIMIVMLLVILTAIALALPALVGIFE